MKSRLSLIACLLMVGCLDSLVSQDTKPAPVGTTLEAVAEQTGRDYLSGMADLCNSTAADLDAGKYKAQSQVADAFKSANDAMRKSTFDKLGQRMNQDVPPGKDLSAADTAKAYRSMANGFKKASGK